MTENITYHLSYPQSLIATCDKRNVVVNAGRRFGKSWLSGAIIMNNATSKYATQRGDFKIWYLAPVADQARTIMWEGWLRLHVPESYIDYKNEQRMIMRLKNGTTISVLSADNPDHLVGDGVDLVVFDEAALMDSMVYEKVRPVLSDKYHLGKSLFISTPRGFNWFHKMYMKEVEDPESWKSFQFTTLDGGNVTEEEIAQSKRDMSPKMFAQEFLASFETMSNRIYYSYDENENLCDFNPTWALGDIHVGMDFNVNPMTATISHIEQDKKLGRDVAYCFDEILEPNSDTRHTARLIKQRYPNNTLYVYPDPTGKKRQTSACGTTDLKILEEEGFIVCAPYAPYASKDKWNTANTALCNAAGERRVFIARDKCKWLKDALKGYSFKENGEPDKSGGLDHITDAFAYFLNYRFPMDDMNRIYRPEILGV